MLNISRLGARLAVPGSLALAALIIAFGLADAARAGEDAVTLRSFCRGCADGYAPWSGIVRGPDGAFYGTTFGGGNDTPYEGQTYGAGVVYRITAAGKFTVLHALDAASEGAYPNAGVTVGADGYLYGTASAGGSGNGGCVFRVSSSGDFTVLHEFDVSSGGWSPYSPPVEDSEGNWYGTTLHGGANADGIVYEIKQDGTFLTLYTFSGFTDGADPQGGLVLADDGNLYGSTLYGGLDGAGTVFRITPAGVLTTLYDFADQTGSHPTQTLTLGKGGALYGTTSNGGPNGVGTVFRIATDGTLRTIYAFVGAIPAGPTGVLTAAPDGSFYGVSAQGGVGYGALYRITPSGKYTELYDFTGESPGGLYPEGAIALAKDGALYGATLDGGRQGGGAVFRYAPPEAEPE